MTAVPIETLVVVADGRGARMFRNVGGPDKQLQLHQYAQRELMNTNDDGPSGSMPGESDSRQLDEATFAKQLAHDLNEAALKHKYQHLVLIADPTTLGRIRPLLHKQVNVRLLAEIGKDFTNATLDDIQQAVGKSAST